MIIIDPGFDWLWLLPILYVVQPRTWVPGELVTSNMMNTLRDLFLEIEAGTAELAKATLVGADTATLATIPSDAGQAAIAYDSTLDALVQSIDGGSYSPIGTSVRDSFRGLILGTHPDATDEASKVHLDKLVEAFMQDGIRIADWTNLVADITAAGAGGLDTGTEAASTWYDVYAIRKSSDDTRNLLLHKSDTPALATSFTTTADASRALRLATNTATDKIAQGFQVASTLPLEYVDVLLSRANAVTGNVWFTIEADNAGNPSGTPLATSDKYNAANIATSAQWIRFAFRGTSLSLTASTQYHLVMQGDYTRSDANYIGWSGLVAGGYASGNSKDYDGTTWSATPGASGLDRSFRVYTRVASNVTMPSGYDQRCHIGHVYNDGSSNFRWFRQVDRQVMMDQVQLVAGSTSAVSLLIDMLSLLPPEPVVVANWWSLVSAGAYFGIGMKPGATGTTPHDHGGIFYGNGNTQVAPITVPVDENAVYVAVQGGGTLTLNVGEYRW